MKFPDQIKNLARHRVSSHTSDKFQLRLALIILLAAIDQRDRAVVIDVASVHVSSSPSTMDAARCGDCTAVVC
jgi:hypothetical protein